jgi:hypothetical protein
MAPASPKVQNLVEATDEAFSGFQPERVVPDVEALLAHLPEWFDSIGSNWKKFAEQAQGDLPVHPDVSEAMLDMMPHIQALSEAAGKVNELFRQRHADDLKRHYEPRAGEAKWDVNA